MGGFDCEFVEPPPDILQTECPVCLLIIREPQQVTCCGYSFCHSCIQQIKDKNKRCPVCNEEGFSNFPDKKLKRNLYAFKVYCSLKEDGCKWTGELRQLDIHLNKVPNPEKQLDGCQFVEIDCLFDCGSKLKRRYMQKHQVELCSRRILSCEYCHEYESSYDDVTQNHWPVCGSFLVHCPNNCGVFLQRKKLSSHTEDECPLTIAVCEFCHVGCDTKLPRKDIPEHLRDSFVTHMSLLAASHAKQQAKIATYQSKTLYLEQTIDNLLQQNTQLKTNLAQLSAKLVSNPRTTIPLTPPVLMMSSFQQHKRNKGIWLSPPFYTHAQGYKVCLRVNASGHGNDSHVSVFVHFVKGEFDDLLKWPFRGAIHIQVLDQIDGSKNISHTFQYDDRIRDSACSRVTGGEMSVTGRGESKLIAHSQLEPRYLRSDTLLFQMDKVELR